MPAGLGGKVIEVLPQGTHDLFLAEVVAVDVDDSIVDENGRLCLDRAGLAAFAHGEYFALGDKLGNFGFSVAKKRSGKPAQTGKSPARKPARKKAKPAPQRTE